VSVFRHPKSPTSIIWRKSTRTVLRYGRRRRCSYPQAGPRADGHGTPGRKSGLRGKAYIDARGLVKLSDPIRQPGGQGEFDRELLLAAKNLEEQAGLEVMLETTPQLFQPGQGADAALYAGWFSPCKYIDAFR
jgi:hypothetical protein